MFGLSFGKKKTSGSQDSTINKTETGTQQQTGATASTSTGSTNVSQTGSSSGLSTTTQGSTQNVSQTGTQTQTGTTQQFSDEVLSGLDAGVQRLIGQIFDPNKGDRAFLGRGMDMLGSFDVDSFVQSGMRAAQQKEGTQLGAAIRGLFSSIGGTGEENSAARLLGQNMTMDAEDRLAGRQAELTAQGEGIVDRRAGAIGDLFTRGSEGSFGFFDALKGALSQVTGQTTDQSNQSTTGNVAGTTATQEQNQQQSQTITMQDVMELVNMLTNVNSQTTATERTRTKGKESGGGISLSL